MPFFEEGDGLESLAAARLAVEIKQQAALHVAAVGDRAGLRPRRRGRCRRSARSCGASWMALTPAAVRPSTLTSASAEADGHALAGDDEQVALLTVGGSTAASLIARAQRQRGVARLAHVEFGNGQALDEAALGEQRRSRPPSRVPGAKHVEKALVRRQTLPAGRPAAGRGRGGGTRGSGQRPRRNSCPRR